MRSDRIIGLDASRSYRQPATGTERYSNQLIEHLLELEISNQDYRYRLYFNEPPPADANLPGAEIRALPSRRLWTHLRLSRELRENPIDLLFVPSHVLPAWHPQRSVVTVHDLGYLYEPDSYHLSTRLQLRWTTRWNASRASHIIAISDSTRRDLIHHCGVDPSRITVIRHGVDERFRMITPEDVERYRRAARLPERFVLYLGTIQPRKNLARLITAFERVALVDEDIHLVFAGAIGWKSDAIRRRAQESPVSDRIRFLGYVPDQQLPLLYSAASVLALPSLYEGFGLPVLEAMACGVPVTMSDRGALPELAGADAIVVDPLDSESIAEGIWDAVARSSDETARQDRVTHASQFSWRRSAEDTRSVLFDALDSTPGG